MAGKKASSKVLSARYAKAFFELSKLKEKTDVSERDLKEITKIIKTSEVLRKALSNPVASRKDMTKAAIEIFKKVKISAITEKFCAALGENRRLALIPEITKAFEELAAEDRGEANAIVISAEEMDDEQIEKIRKSCEKMTGKKVNIEEEINEEILGGVIVKLGSKMIDGSIQGKLDRIKIMLKGSDAAA